jgi:hypothetical protein
MEEQRNSLHDCRWVKAFLYGDTRRRRSVCTHPLMAETMCSEGGYRLRMEVGGWGGGAGREYLVWRSQAVVGL